MDLIPKQKTSPIVGWRDTQEVHDAIDRIMEETGAPISDVKKVLIRNGIQRYDEKNSKPVKAKHPKTDINFDKWPDVATPHILADWLKAKKQAGGSISQTAINTVGGELHKAVAMGFTVDECLSVAENSKWKGFKAEWMKKHPAGYLHSKPITDNDFIDKHTDKSWADGL